jgi:hypothetical protein
MSKIAIAMAMAVCSCANNVPQDRSTGPDGRLKGAKAIPLVEGEGVSRGIVTYPGGDRVDWKLIELPAGKTGRLDLEMKWVTPRPGLQLGFDVFDAWSNPIATAKGSKGKTRDASVTEATGKYFVRVYAKGRGDAGEYKLAVAFHETVKPKPVDPLTWDIPEPPRLASVPGQPCETFDVKDPDCKNVCPPSGAPAKWDACGTGTTATTTTTVTTPPVPPTPPPPPPKPIMARVLKVDVNDNNVFITISAGSDMGVDKETWTGQVMRGSSNQPLPGGKITLVRVDKQRSIARVGLTQDIVNANQTIKLAPIQQ